jgi:hypothetical protein
LAKEACIDEECHGRHTADGVTREDGTKSGSPTFAVKHLIRTAVAASRRSQDVVEAKLDWVNFESLPVVLVPPRSNRSR